MRCRFRLAMSILAFCAIAAAAEPATPRLAVDYFPIAPGTLYTYHSVFRDKEYNATIRVDRRVLSDKTEVVYFADVTAAKRESFSIMPNNFGLGCYFREKQDVYTIEAYMNHELEKVTSAGKQQLLPAELKVGTHLDLHRSGGDPKMTLEVQQSADVIKVPAGEYKDCVKIHIHETWASGKEYDSDVWLARGVGMVKWVRSTGRVDELVKFAPGDGVGAGN
jgi:hypothetical protein